mmetsp:Transcript_7378/g.18028  ORF Transcript_7378/g.18028 Transcript_7378/m.18028 type:complete len:156 (-) Transcript_7378:318-785(-)
MKKKGNDNEGREEVGQKRSCTAKVWLAEGNAKLVDEKLRISDGCGFSNGRGKRKIKGNAVLVQFQLYATTMKSMKFYVDVGGEMIRRISKSFSTFLLQYFKTRRNHVENIVLLHSTNCRNVALRVVLVGWSDRVLQEDETITALLIQPVDGDRIE